MRHVKTRKGGRITFGRVEWVVIPIGSREPAAAGCDFFADKYYQDALRMPLWMEGRTSIKADAYAHRSCAYSSCGLPFLAATDREAQTLAERHMATCETCKSDRGED